MSFIQHRYSFNSNIWFIYNRTMATMQSMTNPPPIHYPLEVANIPNPHNRLMNSLLNINEVSLESRAFRCLGGIKIGTRGDVLRWFCLLVFIRQYYYGCCYNLLNALIYVSQISFITCFAIIVPKTNTGATHNANAKSASIIILQIKIFKLIQFLSCVYFSLFRCSRKINGPLIDTDTRILGNVLPFFLSPLCR